MFSGFTLTASCVQSMFMLMLGTTMGWYKKTGERIAISWDTLKADESGRRLAVDAVEGLHRDQRISRFPIP